jgi:hypothetical protein
MLISFFGHCVHNAHATGKSQGIILFTKLVDFSKGVCCELSHCSNSLVFTSGSLNGSVGVWASDSVVCHSVYRSFVCCVYIIAAKQRLVKHRLDKDAALSLCRLPGSPCFSALGQ